MQPHSWRRTAGAEAAGQHPWCHGRGRGTRASGSGGVAAAASQQPDLLSSYHRLPADVIANDANSAIQRGAGRRTRPIRTAFCLTLAWAASRSTTVSSAVFMVCKCLATRQTEWCGRRWRGFWADGGTAQRAICPAVWEHVRACILPWHQRHSFTHSVVVLVTQIFVSSAHERQATQVTSENCDIQGKSPAHGRATQGDASALRYRRSPAGADCCLAAAIVRCCYERCA